MRTTTGRFLTLPKALKWFSRLKTLQQLLDLLNGLALGALKDTDNLFRQLSGLVDHSLLKLSKIKLGCSGVSASLCSVATCFSDGGVV